MLLFVESMVACILFTVLIMPPLYKNPLNQIASYPPAIKERVKSLPQYKDLFEQEHQKHVLRKILAAIISVFSLALIAYFSNARSFSSAFYHTFMIFFVVNIYDLIVLDIIIFCHSKKSIIKGTEDMVDEYRKINHHVRGAVIGTILGTIMALSSVLIVVKC
ncbi:MAG: hypothetical protein R3Y57_02385 [Erysipelotrichaceae bacterium]